jgi:hypothetical protein
MRHSLIIFALASLVAPAALAQQLLIYPANGQSAEQQSQDEAECRVWATQQTGFDPAVNQPPAGGSSQAGQGVVVGGAARGAALGAVGGAIAGNAGKGAAVGAGVGAAGGLFNRMGARRQQEAHQQQAQAQYQGQSAEFSRAVATCATGRGYTVS